MGSSAVRGGQVRATGRDGPLEARAVAGSQQRRK
jgi:hypothetical protein